jgi:hypothetical protein
MQADYKADYQDDLTILDSEVLLRRVPSRHVIWDKKYAQWRAASSAFEDHDNGTPMSVVIEGEVSAQGRQPDSVIANFPTYSLVRFSAGEARQLGLGLIRSPLADEPAHAEIFGKKTKAVKKKLSLFATWVVLRKPDEPSSTPHVNPN